MKTAYEARAQARAKQVRFERFTLATKICQEFHFKKVSLILWAIWRLNVNDVIDILAAYEDEYSVYVALNKKWEKVKCLTYQERESESSKSKHTQFA